MALPLCSIFSHLFLAVYLGGVIYFQIYALELRNLRKKVNTLSVSLNICFYVFPSSECLLHPTFIDFKDLTCSEMLFSGIDLQIDAKNDSNLELIM